MINEEVTILWGMQTNTDKEFSSYKRDIVIKDHASRFCQPISMCQYHPTETPRQRSLKNISKYKDVEIEFQRFILRDNNNNNNNNNNNDILNSLVKSLVYLPLFVLARSYSYER